MSETPPPSEQPVQPDQPMLQEEPVQLLQKDTILPQPDIPEKNDSRLIKIWKWSKSYTSMKFSDWLVVGLAALTLWVTWTIGATEKKQDIEISKLSIIAKNDTTAIAKLTVISDKLSTEIQGVQGEVEQLRSLSGIAQRTFRDGHEQLGMIKSDNQRKLDIDQKAYIAAHNRIISDLISYSKPFNKWVNDSLHSFTQETNQQVQSWADQFYTDLGNLLNNRYIQEHPFMVREIQSLLGYAHFCKLLVVQQNNNQLAVARGLTKIPSALNYLKDDDENYNKLRIFIDDNIKILLNATTEMQRKHPN